MSTSSSPISGFRARLIVALVLLNCALVAVTIFSIRHGRVQDVRVAELTTANLARSVEQSLHSLITDVDHALLAARDEMERLQALDRFRPGVLSGFLARQLTRLPNVLALRATDVDGNIVHGNPPGVRANIAEREHFVRARDAKTDRLIVAPPVVSKIDNKWTLVLARRLENPDGSFAGIVYASVALETLARNFAQIDVGKLGGVALRDADLGLIVRVPSFAGVGANIGDKSISSVGKELVANGKTAATYTAVTPADNIRRTISFRKVGLLPLYIFVTLAEDEYLADWRTEARVTLGIVATFILLSAAFGVLLWRSSIRQERAAAALAESENLFRMVTEHASDWVYWRSADRRSFHYIAPLCEEITGYTTDEFMADGELLDRIVHPDDRERWDHHIAERCKAGAPSDYRIVTKTGEVRWIRHACREVVDADGRPMGRRAANQDITAQKRAEAATERQLASLRALNEIGTLGDSALPERFRHALSVGVRHFGLEFGIVSRIGGNEYRIVAQVAPLGTLHDGQVFALGETYCAMTVSEHGVVAIDHMAQSDRLGHPCYRNFKLEAYIGAPIHVDGAIYGTVNFSSPYPYRRSFDDGDREFVTLLARWVGAAIEREHTGRRIVEQNRRMRALLDATTESTLLLAPDGRIQAINQVAAQRFGLTPEEMVGHNFFDYLPAELAASRRAQLEQATGTGEAMVTRDERNAIRFENSIYPVKDDDGHVEALAVYAKNISEEWRATQIEAMFHRLDLMLLKWRLDATTIAQMFCDDMLPIFELDAIWIGRAGSDGMLTFNAGAERDGSGFFDRMRSVADNWHDVAHEQIVGPVLRVPLTLRGEHWGVLVLHAHEPTLFERPDMPPRIESVAGRLAVSLEACLQQQWLSLLELALANAGDAVMITDAAANIVWANSTFLRMSGYRLEELLGHTPKLFASGEHDAEFFAGFWQTIAAGRSWRGDVVNRHRNGSLYTVAQTVTALNDANGQISHYVSIQEDITERKAAAARIEHLANFDTLTELPNRGLFLDRLGQALALARRDGHPGALLFLDLDKFKAVNDTLGHEAGDLLLQQVAQRLCVQVRESDTVARLAGDEFTVILPHVGSTEDTAGVAAKIVAELSRPFDLAGESARIGVSIGIAIFPADGDDVQAILKAADHAMYRAKEAGRGTYRFFAAG